MNFNGIEKSYVTVIKGRVLPFFAPLSRSFSRFDSKKVYTERDTRIIQVPIFITHKGYQHYQQLKEDIAKWLVHDEPKKLTFKDDPNRFYWAVVEGEITEEEIYDHGAEIIVTFACGYKYSEEKVITLDLTRTIVIGGHNETDWTIEVEFDENASQYTFEFKEEGKEDLKDVNRITLNHEFKSSDRLSVNFSQRKITLNGKDIYKGVQKNEKGYQPQQEWRNH